MCPGRDAPCIRLAPRSGQAAGSTQAAPCLQQGWPELSLQLERALGWAGLGWCRSVCCAVASAFSRWEKHRARGALRERACLKPAVVLEAVSLQATVGQACRPARGKLGSGPRYVARGESREAARQRQIPTEWQRCRPRVQRTELICCACWGACCRLRGCLVLASVICLHRSTAHKATIQPNKPHQVASAKYAAGRCPVPVSLRSPLDVVSAGSAASLGSALIRPALPRACAEHSGGQACWPCAQAGQHLGPICSSPRCGPGLGAWVSEEACQAIHRCCSLSQQAAAGPGVAHSRNGGRSQQAAAGPLPPACPPPEGRLAGHPAGALPGCAAPPQHTASL